MKLLNPLVTILITNFNKEKYLLKCLNSCINQSYKNLEIIIIDNASTDKSLEVISKFKKVKLYKNRKRTKSKALNQLNSIEIGLKKSKGKIICLLDSDDFFKLNKVKEVIKKFNINIKSNVVFDIPNIYSGNSDITNFKYNFSRLSKHHIWATTFPTSSISLRKNHLNFCLNFFKKKKFSFLEIDFMICCISINIFNSYIIHQKKLTFYRQAPNSIMSNYPKFGKNWWIKREEAFDFFIFLKKSFNKKYFFSIDYFITKIVSNILRWF